MTPIDAADLDNTGRSVWVFHTSRGEEWDGYELFYEDLSKTATFKWSYHLRLLTFGGRFEFQKPSVAMGM
jgi:hypothetical protein